MASERRVIAYRPDEAEEYFVTVLAKRHGLAMSRLIGQAVRQMAKREGVEFPDAMGEPNAGEKAPLNVAHLLED